jgi:hypothetical protein
MAHLTGTRGSCLRAALLVTAVAAAANVLGCGGSSTTTITSPGTLPKCGVTVSTVAQLPAAGGSGQVAITTARECAWAAEAEGAWLSIKAGASGQGDGAVQFEAASNPDPSVRRGAIVLNDKRAEITQAAAACTITLAENAASFDPAGGSGQVNVRASSALCPWTAVADVDWISIRSGATGTGTAAVAFDVPATTGPPRTGGITIAGQRFTVTQSQGCTYSLNPTVYQTGSEGGSANIAVTTTGGCPWTASSSVDWITVTAGGTSITGSGTASFNVAPTTGPTRSATVTIAGHPVTVTQGQGCSYTLSPDSAAAPPGGANVPVAVAAGAGCAWTATSNTPWITVASGSQGTGNGTVQLSVSATTGPNRSGTATIAGRTFTVNQGQGCSFTIAPASASINAGGGQGSFAVQTESGCAWSANEDAEWLSIASGASGAGNGTVTFTATPNTGPARSTTITAAGQTFTVSQAGGCSYALSSTSTNVPGTGGPGTVGVATQAGCAWTAASNADWITITDGAQGAGNGTVSFTAAARSGASRSGTLTIAGLTFTIDQAEACSYSVSPTQQNVAAGAGTVAVSVEAAAGCRWTAAAGVPWITVPAGAGGTGNGSVPLTVAANTGAARSGTATVAGRTVTINQASGCSYAIAPMAQTLPGRGGDGTVAVTATAACAWTAASNIPWARVASGASGTGGGTVQFTADPNPGPARTGTFTIAGQTFTLTEEADCSYVVAPETFARGSGASTDRVDVSAATGCAWTAGSNAPWLTVTSGASGSGNGRVEFAIAANTGPARTGTLTVATRTVTVNQDSGCTFALSAPSYAAPVLGGPGTVNITAPADCPWTAVSQVPWVIVTVGAAGSGDGAILFLVTPNLTGAARSGAILIAGQTFTVTQD